MSLTNRFVASVAFNPWFQAITRNETLGVPAVALPLLLAFNVLGAPQTVAHAPQTDVHNTTYAVPPVSNDMLTHLNEVKRRFTL